MMTDPRTVAKRAGQHERYRDRLGPLGRLQEDLWDALDTYYRDTGQLTPRIKLIVGESPDESPDQ